MFIRFIGNLVICVILLWNVQGAPPDPEGNGENLRNAKSKEVLQYLNQSMDPCDNFFNFACGNYHKFYKPIELEALVSTLQLAYRDLKTKTLKLLTTDDENENDIDRKVKNFYQSCMSYDVSGVTIKDKLKSIIGEFGKMPVLEGDKWNGDDFDWLKSIAEISHKYDFHIIMNYKIVGDILNSTMPRVALMAPTLELGKPAVYLEAAYENNRRDYIKSNYDFLRLLGVPADVAKKTANEIVNFEISLAKGMLENDEEEESEEEEEDEKEQNETSEESSEEQSNGIPLYTLEKLQTEFKSELDFKKWMRISLGSLVPEKVLYFDHTYFVNLIEIINKTPKAVQANYIFLKLAKSFVTYATNNQKIWDMFCFHTLRTYFSPNLDNMIYRNYRMQDVKQGVQFVWQQIKSSFEKDMQSSPNLDWMSKDTRNAALEKVNAMSFNIMTFDQHNFSKKFDLLTFKNDDYIANLQSLFVSRAVNTRSKLTQLLVPENDMARFSASFINRLNSIEVPIVYLEPNYYWSHSYPNAVNFGNLGFTLGHELIHGFDNAGRSLDKTGANKNWFDDKSLTQFLNGNQCFRDQYKNYKFNGRPLKDIEFRNEDIADNGGIRLAYNAYLDWYENNLSTKLEKLESLPGLNYNNKQLFFIAFAQSFCSVAIPSQSKLGEANDKHTPEEFRIIGSLSNLEEFAKEFSCPSGSVMNPAKKCKIY